MENSSKRYWILPIAAFLPAALLCCLLIGGCSPRSDAVEPPTMSPTPSHQASPSDEMKPPTVPSTPTLQATPRPTPEPPTRIPTTDLQATPSPTPSLTKTPVTDPRVLQAYGSLLYVAGRSVWEGMGLASDRLVTELPFEKIHAVTLADDRLWVLADDQLAVVDLTSGTVETMTEVELSVWGGDLLVLWNRRSVAYTVGMNDDSNLLGHSTRVGLYNPRTGQTRMLTKLVGSVRLLGATPEEDKLYATQIGGDGSGPILTINLEDGTTTTKIEPQGFSYSAVMSPDGHWVAVIDIKSWSQPEEQGRITLYKLAEPDASPMVIDLPKQPSHARGLEWAPDSRYLYFVLYPGPWAGDSNQPLEQTWGLWRADIRGGQVKQIVPSVSVDHYPVAVSPDGRAVLIAGYPFALIDVQTGVEYALNLPGEAIMLAWRASDTQD